MFLQTLHFASEAVGTGEELGHTYTYHQRGTYGLVDVHLKAYRAAPKLADGIISGFFRGIAKQNFGGSIVIRILHGGVAII